MKNNFIKTILGFSIIFLFMTIANGTQDFSINQTSFTINKELSQAVSGTIYIENTGDENISLSISKTDLTDSSNTITLNIDKTSILNLSNGNTNSFDFSFNSGTNTGTYTASILLENTQNSSQSISIPISLTVIDSSSSSQGVSVKFKDFESQLVMVIDIDDSSEKETFRLINNGNETITNIKLDLDNLDGDDDEIDNDEIEINGEPADNTIELDDLEGNNFQLVPNEEYNVKIDIDIPTNLDVDDYRGTFKIIYTAAGETQTQTFTLKVIAESDNEDVYIDQSSTYVRDGILEIVTEEGETEDDFEFIIVNDGSFDISDLRLQLDSDFKEEDSGRTMSRSVVTFDSTTIDVDERDDERIDFEVIIPENQASGTYLADIELISSSGKKLDEIQLRIKVTGDIFVKTIKYNKNAKPGENLDVEITIRNKGSQVYRNIKVVGTLFDVDSSNSNIIESTSNFLLEVERERKETLRFKLPDDASDGSHTFELRITYDGNDLTEVETVEITRPITNININSYAINPIIAKCDSQLFSFLKIENFGKYDEDIKITTEILNTNIKKESSLFELNVDEITQKNQILDITDLEPGTYNVVQKVIFSGSQSKKKTTKITVRECTESGFKIIIDPINDTNFNINRSDNNNESTTDTNSEKIALFGSEFEKSTIYLGSGLALVTILIIISLFLL